MLRSIITSLFFLFVLSGSKNIDQQKDTLKSLEVSVGEGIYIRIYGNDAMEIYNYLSDSIDNGSMDVSHGGAAGTYYLYTPAIYCERSCYDCYDPPLKKDLR